MEELAEREELPGPIADAARLTYEQRIHRLGPQVDGDGADGDDAANARRIRELRREFVSVERSRLADLRRKGEISAESMRRIEHELDLDGPGCRTESERAGG